MSQLDYLIKLKEQLVIFLDELIELFPKEQDFVFIRIFIKDRIPIVNVMDYIIHKLIPLKQLILDKNDEFFLNNNILFEQVDNNKVNHFKRMWTDKKLCEADKNTIWAWFKSFIVLAEKYKLAS